MAGRMGAVLGKWDFHSREIFWATSMFMLSGSLLVKLSIPFLKRPRAPMTIDTISVFIPYILVLQVLVFGEFLDNFHVGVSLTWYSSANKHTLSNIPTQYPVK